MFLLKLRMQDGFPRTLVLFETSQLFNLTGAWTNTHSRRLYYLNSHLIIWINQQKHSPTSTKPCWEKQSHMLLIVSAGSERVADTLNTTLLIHIIVLNSSFISQDESETDFLQNERFSVKIFSRHTRTKCNNYGNVETGKFCQMFLNWILIDLLSILTLHFL